MKLRTWLIDGLIFLLPIMLMVWLLLQAVKGLRHLASLVVPVIAPWFPDHEIAGVSMLTLLAIVLLLALVVLAGWASNTPTAQRVTEFLEQTVLRRLPGYTLLKGASGQIGGSNAPMRVALARIDGWVLAFVIEVLDDGQFTVFVPSAPTPAAGTVYILSAEQLRFLDVPVTSAMGAVLQLGLGLGGLLRADAASRRQKGEAPPEPL